MPRLRRVEQPRRDGRPRAVAALNARQHAGTVGAGASRGRSRTSRSADVPRLTLGIGELDRVLGGGLVPGSLVLLGGEPGIGKSTLLLQAAAGLAARRAAPPACCTRPARSRPVRSGCVPPASGCWPAPRAAHPGPRRARHRADRRGRARGCARRSSSSTPSRPPRSEELEGPAGSVGQVRESALRLMELAKGDGIAVVLVGPRHQGRLASPDRRPWSTSSMRSSASRASDYAALRLLRAAKNRFGSTEEIGVFEMADAGLMRGRRSGTRVPRRPRRADAPGSVVAPTMEGSRPMLVEVQALVAPGRLRDARPTAPAASTRTGSPCSSPSSAGEPGSPSAAHDVYATSPAACRSASRVWTCPLPWPSPRRCAIGPIAPGTVAIGEVGLLGELRGVAGLERRLREAARLGLRPGDRAAARAAASPAPIDGPGRSGPSRRSADAIDVALAERAESWRGGPGDARLTARRVDRDPGLPAVRRGSR